jgi:hypothetical protein
MSPVTLRGMSTGASTLHCMSGGQQERRFYDAESLQRGLREFERSYGIRSAELVERYRQDDLPTNVPRFAAHVWVSFVEDVERLCGGGIEPWSELDQGPIERVQRAFAHA